ncbi:hypothetical protein O181_071146 [Austropuccinia psidii MF-1]|uniref:Integrase catalytic domain-containing protein n=1 Tax=Austropuccinia psidii MF-1 TaxID=1389203 RepID=A0A9Q3I6A3_9BASI|nr:hypothetical protein [Austropuccinia psidii MF-1]
MDWVTELVPGGKENYNSCLFIVNRFRKSFRCPPCHKEDRAMNTTFLFLNDIIDSCGIPKIIISDRDPKFTLELWTSFYDILGTNLTFYTNGLGERMIQTMEEIIRRFCAYFIKYKDT